MYVIFFGNNMIDFFLNPGSKPQSFMQALHEAISALSLQLFNFSFKWITAEVCKCYLNTTTHSHNAQVGMDNLISFYSQNSMLQRGSRVH